MPNPRLARPAFRAPSAISEPKDEDNAGRHEKATNGAPSVQGVHRHVHQAEVVNGERGEKIRRNNQPIDRSGPEGKGEGKGEGKFEDNE